MIVPVVSPWYWQLLPLSSRSPPLSPLSPPSPPSPGSLRPSALWLLPLGADGRGVGGVLGHLVMPLLLLDTDTSIVRKEDEEEERKPKGKRMEGRSRRGNVKEKDDRDGWDDEV